MSQALTQIIERTGGNRRALLALVGIGAAAVIFGFSRWAMAPAWAPIAQGLPMESIGAITNRLDEEGLRYRLEAGGSAVTVPEPEAARARVILATQGLPASGRPGFELFDEPSWGMTDFTQRVNYRRALEGELERTIGKMRGVESAQVHLALQESSFLRRTSRPAEASVVLALHSGMRPEDGMVAGIASLVASSVEGLDPDNVTVLGEGGRLLSAGPDLATAEGLTDRQLEIRRSVEEHLEAKALDQVTPIVGNGNADVRVSVDLNFDRIDRTVQSFDPDQQVTMTEDRSEILPSTDEQGAASLTTNSTFEVGQSVETLSRGGARIERVTVAVLVNDRPVTSDEGEPPAFEARSTEELARVEALVRNAVGLDERRGDAISVVSIPFDLALPEELTDAEAMDLAGMVYAAQRPAVALFGVLMTVFLALRLLSTVKALPAPQNESVLAAQGPDGALAAAGAEGGQVPHPAAAPLAQPRRVELADPKMTARVVKAWMNEA